MSYSCIAWLIIFTMLNCTGMNMRNWPIEFSPNTHPSSEYSKFPTNFKGGVLLHNYTNILYSSNAKLKRRGKACAASYLYLIALGDARIDTAKVNAGVSSPAIIEQETFSVLGFVFHRHCTIVVGE
ncbi:MAG: TRL domain-containing protein [Leptospiraceae bacterium]|nr:TRL domain-containing protein [Leptospiraceae bacterium]